MLQEDKLYNVWWQNRTEGEQQMEDRHLRGWREVIHLIQEQDLSGMTVLDFGCNQGGFLRHLYQVKPFKEGMGIDLAQESIAVANARKGDLPLTYVATTTPEQFVNRFDLAVSQAVIYLIKDLKTHAWKIKQLLKPGGVYYATYTDLNDNPSLQRFTEWINRNSLVESNAHTLDFIAQTFAAEGFRVELQRRRTQGFIDISREEDGFLCIADKMKASYEQSYIFRFVLTEK
ncbi:class I SAM-dependent methyltransferase [Sporomusa sphaeroides]|uniref:Bifunctional 3-demethylubiquinone-9 3-methyltransferase/ 2-octaprenyl-6-hydroxy phenol methylase n=1 Tax=Sporomusa sphaeroides DSM 2875 TaxID=1337886 RepID=A0ABM9W7E0_9FIRM|nr:class I SAM-dependent methyltransferase [Sporomusa sphaeroides]OLS54487.1 ubiquinone biosynthesis O-methyltransferase [Sporomusa sphaeroides DSM 2875]CVK21042.1 bifunctional 3-demethylubiquinone-9 3-methyltransferase/ 2-octaprenyl-6-hydroxy phenol methylase [Sporomusa sphaeroides DSM 2875]